MDRLTSQKVERLRVTLKLLTDYDGSVSEDEVDALCDLALQSLSQEAVRDEALENVLGIAGMLEFQAKLVLNTGESDIKLDAATIVPKIVGSLRALKREPNAAVQPRHLVRRGLKPDGTYPLADDDEPAPAAPDVCPCCHQALVYRSLPPTPGASDE